MSRLASPLLAIALGSLACSAPGDGREVALEALPVPLNPDTGAERDLGRLRYRAGLHLRAEDPEFGGFSGLVVESDGRLLAVSDRGRWLAAELRLSAAGTLEGVGAGEMGPLRDESGTPVSGRSHRDAEELRKIHRGYLVSFEGDHRILYYPEGPPNQPAGLWGAAEPYDSPPGIRATGANEGMEAMALLEDGRLLIFSEDLRGEEDAIVAWVGGPPEATWETLTLRADEDFLPTGAATLPSGDVVLLERSYSEERGFNRVRLSLIDAAAIVPGARLEPVELALLEPPYIVDNMEAVAVQEGPKGEILLYLLSDDNFSDRQRTLLIQFEVLAE